MSITPKQKKILEFISHYTAQSGYSPSQQEIAEAFGYKSLGTVQDFLIRLQKNGYLEKPWNAKRGIKVRSQSASLPLLGKVAAGTPIEHLIHQEQIEVPPKMIKKGGDYYALLVKGDSMKDDGILDGDYVIVRKQSTAENGQKIIAIIDNGATIKNYFKRKERLELKPANETFDPILLDPSASFRIEGLFVGLIRFTQEKR
ncbi:MAG: transcriptional repressor LexA [Nitrospirae bacterium]|nr:transcriptional repressor LexA [Nitrospirota bacterium]